MVDSEQWLSREEAAREIGVHVRTIDRLVREGHLKRYRIAGTRYARFRIEDVRALYVSNGNGGEGK
jgi:excisionase family DNA binding protein